MVYFSVPYTHCYFTFIGCVCVMVDFVFFVSLAKRNIIPDSEILCMFTSTFMCVWYKYIL
jgi:hypothetical protein